jgi:hypothetical protein
MDESCELDVGYVVDFDDVGSGFSGPLPHGEESTDKCKAGTKKFGRRSGRR